MKIIIEGTAKEVADLALALQSQPEEKFIPSHGTVNISDKTLSYDQWRSTNCPQSIATASQSSNP